jgi:hypothetical protein
MHEPMNVKPVAVLRRLQTLTVPVNKGKLQADIHRNAKLGELKIMWATRRIRFD